MAKLNREQIRAENMALAEVVLNAVSEGDTLQQALQAVKRSRSWLDTLLRRDPELRERFSRATPSPQQLRDRVIRFLSLVASGSDEPEAATSSGFLNLKQAEAHTGKQGMADNLRSVRDAARIVHGKGSNLMPFDEAVLLLSRLSAYCHPHKHSDRRGPGSVSEAWPSLADLLATAGIDEATFRLARQSAPAYWDAMRTSREREYTEWMHQHRQYLRGVSVSSIGHLLGERDRVRMRKRVRKVPMLTTDHEGNPVVEYREATEETREVTKLDPSLPAIEMFIKLETTGQLNPEGTRDTDTAPDETEAALLLEAIPGEADAFLAMATGSYLPQVSGTSSRTPDDTWLHGEPDDLPVNLDGV